MTTAVIYSTTDDWNVNSGNNSGEGYPAVRAGVNFSQDAQFSMLYSCGQEFQGGANYHASQMFLSFDTSAIDITQTVLSATLSLVAASVYATSEGLQARVLNWGAPPVTTSDFSPGATFATLPLVGSLAYSAMTSGTRFDLTDSGLAAQIVKGGTTRLVLCSDLFAAGTAPTTAPNLLQLRSGTNTTTTAPRLTVTYAVTSSCLLGSD